MASLEQALAYLNAGYSIIPEKDKTPLTKWRQYQAEPPSESQVRFWWGKDRCLGYPDLPDIGVICGTGSKLVVVDADDQQAVDYCRLHLPPTPTRVLTSRGMHFYYRHPGGHIDNRQLSREGSSLNIDIKGDGGKVTGMGSRHRTGHIYGLDAGCVLLPASDLPVFDRTWFPKPKRIVTILAPMGRRSGPASNSTGNVASRAERYLSRISGAGRGNRDCHTHRVAASVVRDFGLDEDTGYRLMSQWNETANDPPLHDDDIKRIVRSVLEHGRRPLGNKL